MKDYYSIYSVRTKMISPCWKIPQSGILRRLDHILFPQHTYIHTHIQIHTQEATTLSMTYTTRDMPALRTNITLVEVSRQQLYGTLDNYFKMVEAFSPSFYQPYSTHLHTQQYSTLRAIIPHTSTLRILLL